MEARLFVAACIMYAFSWVSKRLFRKNCLEKPSSFAAWHALFLFLILGCAYFIFSFILNSSNPEYLLDKGNISLKTILIWISIAAVSVYGFFSAKKKGAEGRQPIIKADLDWANTVYFAGFVASIVMFFFIQAFKIPSASMRNTLLEGDHLFVNKAAYGFRIPLTSVRFGEFNKIKKGDVIVFKFPADSPEQINCGGYQYGRDYVKRVVGMPGDKVEVKGGKLYINEELVPEQGFEIYEPVLRLKSDEKLAPAIYQSLWKEHKLENIYGMSLRDDFGPVIVPDDHYFAMGDNRDNSCDSRFWGPVPRENIKGTAWFIHWPLNRISLIK